MTDPTDGLVYSKSISLLSTDIKGVSIVYDWYTYFFSIITKTTDIVLTDLPPYANATLAVTITNPSSTAKCGAIVMGTKANLGTTKYKPELRITDYSTKTADSNGSLS